ncbi:MAG: bifunctional phosphoribosylaminoimidazolecarboxamide formyltransferase/IMP cyclohydrolase [Myxococcota bacterium]
MTEASPIRRALVSVSDKSNLDVLAQLLVEHKVEVLSTGGTARALSELGVAVVQVAEYTGSPEILDGRVKTLHPKIHGGILALPTAAHEAERRQHDIPAIDLVVVNLYPFREVIAKPDCTFEDAVENIDIGGPTMVRSAAKNWTRVAVVVEPSDYGPLADTLRAGAGVIDEATRRRLARKAFAHTAAYDSAIAEYLSRTDDEGKTAEAEAVAPTVFFGGTAQGVLRYGENPHQAAAFVPTLRPGEAPGLDRAIVHQGKALSYNNLLDADAALCLARDLKPLGRAAAVFKHMSPCGAAVAKDGQSLAEVFTAARNADAESAFGGIVALTEPVDEATAKAMVETFLEVIIAPGYAPEARTVLAAKKNLRVLELPGMFDAPSDGLQPLRVRSVCGGVLVQREDALTTGPGNAKSAAGRPPTDAESIDLDLAWRVAKHVKSNAVVLAKAGVTVAIGGGQTSRVEAARQASRRAGDEARGSVLASDGFFPFRDSIDAAAAAGVTAIIQPGGSIRDEEVVGAANEHGLAMVLTGERHFRH